MPLRARLEEAAGDVVQGRQICRAHHGERGGHSGRRSLGRWHRGQGQRDSRGGPRARTRVRTCARSRVRPRARPRALLRARTRASPRRESARGIARGIARDIASKVARRRARSRARSRARHRARDRGASRVAARGATRGGPPRDSLTRRDSLTCQTFLRYSTLAMVSHARTACRRRRCCCAPLPGAPMAPWGSLRTLITAPRTLAGVMRT